MYSLWRAHPSLLGPMLLGQAANRNGSLCLTLFLATLELSIVSTSLVAITDSLKGYDRVSWIVTAYFLTYSSAKQNKPCPASGLTSSNRLAHHMGQDQRYHGPKAHCDHFGLHLRSFLGWLRSCANHQSTVSDRFTP